jgi:hypothetical protein
MKRPEARESREWTRKIQSEKSFALIRVIRGQIFSALRAGRRHAYKKQGTRELPREFPLTSF